MIKTILHAVGVTVFLACISAPFWMLAIATSASSTLYIGQ